MVEAYSGREVNVADHTFFAPSLIVELCYLPYAVFIRFLSRDPFEAIISKYIVILIESSFNDFARLFHKIQEIVRGGDGVEFFVCQWARRVLEFCRVDGWNLFLRSFELFLDLPSKVLA